ncbi:MAG: hypothetical protein JWM69_812, partial [Candidatus Binatus sp.]|nr:hypothetical protein [Candidatus Binatus sp.]
MLLPRVVRMLYPEVWIEDDFYLESAWMVSVGMRPYLDFVHPHFPILEFLAAGYLKLFGPSHTSIEFLNETAIFATCALTFALARRASSQSSAVAAALLLSYSSLLFRYHLYERENFLVPLMVLAAMVALDDSWPESVQGLLIGLLFFLACTIKLTAVIPLAVIVPFLVIVERRIVAGFAAVMVFIAAIGSLAVLLYWRYGSEFILQTFLFHLLKGRSPALEVALLPTMLLDVIAPMFLLGLARLFIDRAYDRGVLMVLAIVFAEYAFYGLLSPTAWGHN